MGIDNGADVFPSGKVSEKQQIELGERLAGFISNDKCDVRLRVMIDNGLLKKPTLHTGVITDRTFIDGLNRLKLGKVAIYVGPQDSANEQRPLWVDLEGRFAPGRFEYSGGRHSQKRVELKGLDSSDVARIASYATRGLDRGPAQTYRKQQNRETLLKS